MTGRVFLGELDQLGDDLAACPGAFIGHTTTVRRNRTDVLCLGPKDADGDYNAVRKNRVPRRI